MSSYLIPEGNDCEDWSESYWKQIGFDLQGYIRDKMTERDVLEPLEVDILNSFPAEDLLEHVMWTSSFASSSLETLNRYEPARLCQVNSSLACVSGKITDYMASERSFDDDDDDDTTFVLRRMCSSLNPKIPTTGSTSQTTTTGRRSKRIPARKAKLAQLLLRPRT
eukprot:CAMPEP_0198230818 /NCGR_PEP_ID=MMETSP1445-20131203/114874_1 /TAXON_ID=36898 /ORGANISM="Pyramimonas sp., Strain CCMP2087" /LENGTH=165 /DNA_ID=CAMNT_0043911399 /DNA_START=36 /DNA_END=533 /DNA_ORIENTATION=-